MHQRLRSLFSLVAQFDRVLSDSITLNYATNWGKWGQKDSQASTWNFWKNVFHIDQRGTMVPADDDHDALMHEYTRDDHNILVVPMTSQNSSDKGVMGLLVFESNEVKARFYPGLNGFNHVGSARETMQGAPGNANTKFPLTNLELYNIYGHLTWVGIYTAPQALGSTPGGFGLMDAKNQSVNKIAFSNDWQTALATYTAGLGGNTGGRVPNTADAIVPLNGTIWRIGLDGASYRFQLLGDAKHYFDVQSSTYPGAPLLRDGDHVSGQYLDTKQALSSVRALELVGDGPAAKSGDKK